MSFKLVCLVLCLLGVALAQVSPPYSCTAPNNCSAATGYTRGQVVGCIYFCRLDGDANSQLSRAELDKSFTDCDTADGADGVCQQATLVLILQQALPICDTEATAIYHEYARQDGDATSFVMADVDIIWNTFITAQGGVPPDAVTSDGFSLVWADMWLTVEDPTCTIAYPRDL